MARIMALDIGIKRTGVAVTDSLQLIASPLDYVETEKIFQYLASYVSREEVEAIVIGDPKNLQGNETDATKTVHDLYRRLVNKFDSIEFILIDERFTSKMALDTMIRGGSKKKDRRVKGNIDKISAAIILQSYLDQRG